MPNVSAPKNSSYRGWFRDEANVGRLSVYLGTDEYMRFELSDHTHVKSVSDTKNVRINSRNYTQTSGDASGVQIKPNQTVATAGITGLEVSPRFASTIAGTNLVGIKCDPVLKGTGGGNLSGSVTAIQCNLDFNTSGSRTISGDVTAFESFLAIPSGNTYSGHISFLRVRTVNIKGWDSFLNLDDANTGVSEASDKDANTAAHTLRVHIADTLFHIQLYADS